MSPKRFLNINHKIFPVIFFFLNIIISNSFKVPMKSKIITIDSNNINPGTHSRGLLEKEMEVINYKFFLMETNICLGKPEQCFKVLYDTGSVYLILGENNSNLKFKTGFTPLMSDTFSSPSERILAIPFKSSVIYAKEVRDIISIVPNYKSPYLFSFALSFNSTESYDYDGILGLGNHYPKLDSENSFDERFSFVHYLKRNGIISKLIFGHEYKDRIHGSLYFGEEPKSMRSGYFKCKVQNFIAYNNKWRCQLLSVYFSGGDSYITLGSTAAFDTGNAYIKGPYFQASDILDRIESIGRGKCEKFSLNFDADNEVSRLICDRDIKKSEFPDLSFDIVGFKMTLLKGDLFRKIIVNGEIKYEVVIIADSSYSYWNFGEPILKNYDMVFNYEDNTVGFVVNMNYLGGDWMKVAILGIIFICVIIAGIYIFSNRKTIFKKRIKEEDIKKIQAKELQETLQIQD